MATKMEFGELQHKKLEAVLRCGVWSILALPRGLAGLVSCMTSSRVAHVSQFEPKLSPKAALFSDILLVQEL